MTVPEPTSQSRVEARVRDAFMRVYGEEPRLFRAPGRVNLIGEHTDYNDGFVLPLAIDRSTFVAALPRDDRRVEVHALDAGEVQSFDLDGPRASKPGHWLSYVEGVARTLGCGRGANLVVATEVPQGAGLSSSAALELSVGLALSSLCAGGGLQVNRVALALAGQKAEHDYVGTRCGIMDQYVSALAQAGHALLIDCRSLEATAVPLALGDAVVLVLDTGVKHALASSEYNVRRAECEEGVRLLRVALPHVRALRDVTEEQLRAYGALLPQTRVLPRCRHVVTENARTLAAVAALRRGDLAAVGSLMAESHRSLRDDYQVSCPELDLLVDAASGHEGVIGARMTGGGFGGSTVNLVRRDAVDSVVEAVSAKYQARFGRPPTALVTTAAGGAAEVR